MITPAALVSHGGRVAVVVGGDGGGGGGGGGGGEQAAVMRTGEVAAYLRAVDPTVRYAVWSAERDLAPLVERGMTTPRVLDLAEAHRIVHGGWRADPARVWASAHELALDDIDTDAPDDLFAALADPSPRDELLTATGQLRSDAVTGRWLTDDARLLGWARAAAECGGLIWEALGEVGPRARALAVSESAAAVLCVELEQVGLPLDRPALVALIAAASGPRPGNEAEARAIRAARDRRVLALGSGHEQTDLRNAAQVRRLLAAIGIDVPTTRKGVLEAYRDAHPLVPALLAWRKDERIATTYGYPWLDAHIGVDDRLRGGWTACDGAAGRMTARNGLHNLPAPMRSAVAAGPGWSFVRADLGQIEPRVLAAVAADPAFAQASVADDLYAPVARTLGVDRAVAKVAVLAAMYGQRSGTAGRALAGLEHTYPRAMAFLDEAYAAGAARASLRTYGGRAIHTAGIADEGSRGRYARNALIQGAAAELFKAWAATVRVTTAPLGARIVLCLHDELLVHCPTEHALEVAARVDSALVDAARRWSGGAPVRFVADTRIITRWSDAGK